MMKDKEKIIYLSIILLLLISNVYFLFHQKEKEIITKEKVVFQEGINPKDNIIECDFKKYKKLLTSEKISTVAIINNDSNEKFIELMNEISYKNNVEIYTLDLRKLSNKNEIEYYELDEKLSTIKSNYLITIKNSKLINIIEFNDKKIYELLDKKEN